MQIQSLTERRKRWFDRKKPTLKIQILKRIALEGRQSKKDLEIVCNSSGTISDTVDYLRGDDYLKYVTAPIMVPLKKRGQPQKYFGLTKKAIDFLIECDYLSEEEFWNMIFYMFNKDFKYWSTRNTSYFDDLTIGIDYVFSKYETYQLNVDKQLFLPHFFTQNMEQFAQMKFTHSFNNDKYVKKTVEILAYGDSLTFDELAKKMTRIHDKKLHRFIEKEIRLLNSIGIIQKQDLGLDGKYDLGHCGLLLLLYYLFIQTSLFFLMSKKRISISDELRTVSNWAMTKFDSKMNTIMGKYKNLLPNIFNLQILKKLKISNFKLLVALVAPYFDEEILIPAGKHRYSSYFAITRALSLRQLRYEEILDNHIEEGLRIFEKHIEKLKTNRLLEPRTTVDDVVLYVLIKIMKRKESLQDLMHKNHFNLAQTKSQQKVLDNMLPFLRKLLYESIIVGGDLFLNKEHVDDFTFMHKKYSITLSDKITFDFYLSYKTLFPQIWNEVKDKIMIGGTTLNEWYDEKENMILHFMNNFELNETKKTSVIQT